MVKPDWDNFKSKYKGRSANDAFEWLCYLLFCKEFGLRKGISGFYNQAAIEHSPIVDSEGKKVGFQSKFFDSNALDDDCKSKIKKDVIKPVIEKYPDLDKLYFYTHLKWTEGRKDKSGKSEAKEEIENFAKESNLEIEWRDGNYFDSLDVCIDHAIISKFFFKETSYNPTESNPSYYADRPSDFDFYYMNENGCDIYDSIGTLIKERADRYLFLDGKRNNLPKIFIIDESAFPNRTSYDALEVYSDIAEKFEKGLSFLCPCFVIQIPGQTSSDVMNQVRDEISKHKEINIAFVYLKDDSKNLIDSIHKIVREEKSRIVFYIFIMKPYYTRRLKDKESVSDIKIRRRSLPLGEVFNKYGKMTDDERFWWFKQIFEYYNNNHDVLRYYKAIFKDEFQSIDSISETMHSLLPESKKDEAFNLLIRTVRDFLKTRKSDYVINFVNSIILLGVYRERFWSEEQAEELKSISIDIIKALLEGPALLGTYSSVISENMIFHWYAEYGWIKNWNIINWQIFTKNIYVLTPDDLYSISDYSDYLLKKEIFCNFYNLDSSIARLAKPLCKYECSVKNNFLGFCDVPETYDDDFKTPTIKISSNDFLFREIIDKEEGILTFDDCIEIIRYAIMNSKNYDYDSELIGIIIKKLKNSIPNLKSSIDVDRLFELLSELDATSYPLYSLDINSFTTLLNELNDKLKKEMANKLSGKLAERLKYRFYYLYALFNVSDGEFAINEIRKLKLSNFILYRNTIWAIKKYSWLENHRLKENIELNEMYEQEFLNEFLEDKKRKEKQRLLEEANDKMISNEPDIIISVDEMLNQIDKIEKYASSNNITNYRKLFFDRILSSVNYDDTTNLDVIPPVFSEYALSFLLNDNSKDDLINCRNEYENGLWRYFYWISRKSNYRLFEDVALKINVSNRIKSTMEKEFSEFLEKTDIQSFLRNQHMVVPFIYYLNIIYDGKVPSWVDKSKIVSLIAFPHVFLSKYGFSIDYSDNMLGDLFEWVKKECDYNESELKKKAIEFYEELDDNSENDSSKADLLHCIIKKGKFDLRDFELVKNATKIEINKVYDAKKSSMLNYELANFWSTSESGLNIDDMINSINFEKIKEFGERNYCYKVFCDYVIKESQNDEKRNLRETIIEKYKRRLSNDGICEILAILGYKRAVKKEIQKYINKGKEVNSEYYPGDFSICKVKTNNYFILRLFVKLYEYSFEKDNDRRNALYYASMEGIKNNVTKRTLSFVKKRISKIIKQRDSENLYSASIKNFVKQLENNINQDD